MVNGMVTRSGPEGKKQVILITRIFGTEACRWTFRIWHKQQTFLPFIDGYQESLRKQETFC